MVMVVMVMVMVMNSTRWIKIIFHSLFTLIFYDYLDNGLINSFCPRVVMITGNPGVFPRYPYPYPPHPHPQRWVQVLASLGKGMQGLAGFYSLDRLEQFKIWSVIILLINHYLAPSKIVDIAV
jgi:hypothetical protein